jgi:hypothetical protein
VVSWRQRVPAVVVSPQGWIPIWSSFFDMLLDAAVFAAVVISVVMWYGDGFGNLDLMVW